MFVLEGDSEDVSVEVDDSVVDNAKVDDSEVDDSEEDSEDDIAEAVDTPVGPVLVVIYAAVEVADA